jgi:hypothetical protein
MGELLRRGFDARLADRNTKGYEMLVGSAGKEKNRVQVKTVRSQTWYVRLESFKGKNRDQVTVYVLLGRPDAKKPVRYFIAKNLERTLKPRLGSPCQHLCKWRNIGTKSRWRRDSFGSKVLLSMEIDALAARTPEC